MPPLRFRFHFNECSAVVTDVGEHTPLDMNTSENAAAVQRLKAIVARYALTKVPQGTADPSCPPFQGINTTAPDGSVQLFIGPWCGPPAIRGSLSPSE